MPAALGSSNGAALDNSGPGEDVDAGADEAAETVGPATVGPATAGVGNSPPEHPEINKTVANAASRAAAAMIRLIGVN